MEKFENVTYFNHPLIQHKISILRKKETGTNEFRHLVEEIAMLEGFEALNDLPLEEDKKISSVFEEVVYEAISMKTCVSLRQTIGAPGHEAMQKVIDINSRYLEEN